MGRWNKFSKNLLFGGGCNHYRNSCFDWKWRKKANLDLATYKVKIFHTCFEKNIEEKSASDDDICLVMYLLFNLWTNPTCDRDAFCIKSFFKSLQFSKISWGKWIFTSSRKENEKRPNFLLSLISWIKTRSKTLTNELDSWKENLLLIPRRGLTANSFPNLAKWGRSSINLQ